MVEYFDEATLVEGLRRGDSAAVRTWFQRDYNRVVTLMSSLIDHQADAEELAQEVFLNCVRQLPLFRGDSQLWTWMQRVARHEAADYFRKKYAKKALRYLPLGESWRALLDTSVSAEAHGTVETVRQVLAAMTEEAGELLLAKYIDGKQVRHIAQEVGKSVKAVESDLFRARNEFRRLYALEQQRLLEAV